RSVPGWLSSDQKRALVAAAFAPDAIVAEVARRADVYPGQLYRWRQELREAGAGFAEGVLATAAGGRIAACTEAATEIEFGGVASLRIPPSIPPELAAAVVAALSRRSTTTTEVLSSSYFAANPRNLRYEVIEEI